MEAQSNNEFRFENILYLTDFSESSETALPFALAMARWCEAKVYALHVIIPSFDAYPTPSFTAAGVASEEEQAQEKMRRVDSQLAGVAHEAIVERATTVWEPVKLAIEKNHIDLIVLGTHGRTGVPKFFLGSVSEEIFRRSSVSVLSIGPGVRGGVHNGARFDHVLFATDFSLEAATAAPYAISLAQKDGAQLILIHVIRKPRAANATGSSRSEISVAEVMHKLYEIPEHAGLGAAPGISVEYGEPAERIVEVARQRSADIIVLGVRGDRLGAATHLERATAHDIVVHAECPVLVIRD